MRRGCGLVGFTTLTLAIAAGAVGALAAAGFREGLFALERALHGNPDHLVATAAAR